jgi:SAM-dependent MidA family methyltransferase
VAPTLGDRVRARIQSKGPMPFRDWMAACLYDPAGGFYERRQHPAGIGLGTHFATSPTLHPFFSHCIAREVAEAWKAAGRPPAWGVVEFGAGTGALAREAIKELKRLGVPATWSAIDVKPGQPIKGGQWLSRPPERFDAVVANEFLDALPFDLFEWQEGAWKSLGVDVERDADGEPAGTGFVYVPMEEAESRFEPGQDLPADGDRCIAMPGNEPWLASLAKAGARFAILVDYGEAAPAADARAYHGHAFADPLAEPGTVDITADVDFAELAQQAARLGFGMQLETQEKFLLRHGVLDAINKIDRTTLEGNSNYLRLRQLLLPTGFGAAFKVARLSRATPP